MTYLDPTVANVLGISYGSQSTPNCSDKVGENKEKQEEGRKKYVTFGLGFKPGTSHTVSQRLSTHSLILTQ